MLSTCNILVILVIGFGVSSAFGATTFYANGAFTPNGIEWCEENESLYDSLGKDKFLEHHKHSIESRVCAYLINDYFWNYTGENRVEKLIERSRYYSELEIANSTQETNHELSVKTDKLYYEGGDTIVISGRVASIILDTPVTLQIFHAGNLADILQTKVTDNGKFTQTALTKGPLWQIDGTYVVRASYGANSIAETKFEFISKSSIPKPPPKLFPEPMGASGYFLQLRLPVSAGEQFNVYADANEAFNFQHLKEFIFSSKEPLELLKVIRNEMMGGENIAKKNLDKVSRWSPDGIETLEYGIHWTKLRAYVDIGRIANQIISMTNGGMSLNTAFAQFDHLLNRIDDDHSKSYTASTIQPSSKPIQQKNVPDFIDPKHGAQYYLDRYNNEPAYKEWFDTNYPGYSIEDAIELAIPGSFPNLPIDKGQNQEIKPKLPEWVRNIFIWYAEERISENELLGAIQFLLDQGILKK